MLTATAVGMIFYLGGINVMVTREFEGIISNGDLIQTKIDSHFKKYTDKTFLISSFPQVQGHLENINKGKGKNSSYIAFYNKVLIQNKNIVEMGLLNLEAKEKYTWKNKSKGEGDFTLLPSDKESLANLSRGEFYVGDIRLKRENAQVKRPFIPLIPVVVPIFNQKGRIGFLYSVYELRDLFTELEGSVKKGFFLHLFNEHGDLLFHPNPLKRFGHETGIRYTVQSEFEFINDGDFLINSQLKQFAQVSDYKGSSNLTFARKIYIDGFKSKFLGILLTTPKSRIMGTVQFIRTQSFFLSTILILLTALIGWFFTRYLMKNLNEITEIAKRYTQGESDLKVNVRSSDEIGILALTFQGMIRQVNERTRVLRKSERKIREARDQAEQALSAKSQLLEDIRNQKTEIERVSKDKDDLLAIVSHDLKNPLAVVETSMDILSEDSLVSQSSTAKDLVRRSKASAQFALNLITDLLDLARLEGGIKLDFEKFNVSELLNSVVDSYFLKSEEKNIKVKIETDGEYEIYADFGRVIQVVNNIFGNALKFTPENGKIVFKVSTFERQRKIDGSGRVLKIEIKDNGPGIPKDKIETIFNKFEQARAKDREIGTGLGLAICKNICNLHSGDIWAESNEGEGAKFVIILPRVLGEAKVEEPEIEAVQKTVLIVDDDEEYRRFIRQSISAENYNILEAKNGEEGLTLFESKKPDLILLDTEMPVKNGIEVLGEIREKKHEVQIPIIMMTTVLDKNSLEVINREADDLIHKSINQEEFKNKVSEHLSPKSLRNFDKNINKKFKSVLIVDDEEGIRELVSERLEGLNFNAIKAKSGVEGLFLLKKYRIDLIISDIRMQEIDGLTLSRIITKDYPEIPIVLMSANLVALPEDLTEKLGVRKLLPKPFDLDDIEDLALEVLGNSIREDYKDIKKEESKKVEIKENVIPLPKASDNQANEKKKKLLLVDDSEDMQMIFKMLMKKAGFDVTVAKNGLEGLEEFKKDQYDAIFMDVNMPEMCGDEAIIHMRKHEEDNSIARNKIVVMTANDTKEDVKKYLSLGFDGFISKPLNKDKILEQINKDVAS